MSLHKHPVRELHEILTPEEMDRVHMSQFLGSMRAAFSAAPPEMRPEMSADFSAAADQLREAFRAKWGPRRSARQQALRDKAMAMMNGTAQQDPEPTAATYEGKTYRECSPSERAAWKASDPEGFAAVRELHEGANRVISEAAWKFKRFAALTGLEKAAWRAADPAAYEAARTTHFERGA